MGILHQAKVANHGTPGIWFSYADSHPIGTYHIFCPKIKKITKDMTFLEKSYGDWIKVEIPTVVPVSYEGSDEEEEVKLVWLIMTIK